jgi:hypothetical protein
MRSGGKVAVQIGGRFDANIHDVPFMTFQRLKSTDLAGIQYLGRDGITASCIKAVTQLLSSGSAFNNALLLTCGQEHAVLLCGQYEDFVAVKSGFSSGYCGEGPRGLATVLLLLQRHRIEIEEYRVSTEFMHRLAQSALLKIDIDLLFKASPVRPQRWYDYVNDQGMSLTKQDGRLVRFYSPCLPYAVIDERIIDLAVQFPDNEDASIICAYRRLEDLLRRRTGIAGEGTRLFSKVFIAENAPLSWDVPDLAESKGRGTLFNAIYMAFRNARAHREIKQSTDSAVREFLLVNELFRLEAESCTEFEMKRKRTEEAEVENMERVVQQNIIKNDCLR